MDRDYIYGYLIGTPKHKSTPPLSTQKNNTAPKNDSKEDIETIIEPSKEQKKSETKNIQENEVTKKVISKILPEKKVDDSKYRKKDDKDGNFVPLIIIGLFWFIASFLAYALLHEPTTKKSQNIIQTDIQEDLIDEDLAPLDSREPIINKNKQDSKKIYVVTKNFSIDNGEYLEELLTYGDIDNVNANDVKKLQRFLKSKGYRVKVNGVFDLLTKNALKRFQSRYNLTADGVLGKKTRALINKLIRDSHEYK